MKNWIKSLYMINWPAVKKDNLWTTDSTKKPKNFETGDRLIFFISGTNNFCGVFEAVSDWYEDAYTWPDTSVSNYRIDLKPIQFGYADFPTLSPKLEFSADKPRKKLGGLLINSGGRFANWNTPISDKDCELLLNELKKNQTPPEQYTKEEKKTEREKNRVKNNSDIKYWVIRAGREGSDWPTQRDNGFVGIGYVDFGTLSDYYEKNGILTSENKQKIREKIGNVPRIQEYDEGGSREAAISQILISFNDFMKIKPKDCVVALDGKWKVLGIGTVTGNYQYQSKFDYQHTVPVTWNNVNEFELDNPLNTPGTIFEISKQRFEGLISKKGDSPTLLQTDEHSKNMIIEKLRLNKQIVLYGPPGTSKTYTAKKLAVQMLSEEDIDESEVSELFKDFQNEGVLDLVQFHPSYAYEDFVQGIKPTTNSKGTISYEVRDGIFKKMCENPTTNQKSVALRAMVKEYEKIEQPFLSDKINFKFFTIIVICTKSL